MRRHYFGEYLIWKRKEITKVQIIQKEQKRIETHILLYTRSEGGGGEMEKIKQYLPKEEQRTL